MRSYSQSVNSRVKVNPQEDVPHIAQPFNEAQRHAAETFRQAPLGLLRDGPCYAVARVRDALLDACPEFEGSWGLAFVAELVAEGRVPEIDVAKAIERYRNQRSLDAQGLRRPITSQAGYFAVVLGDTLRRHGIPWRKPAESTRKRQTG